MMYKFLFIYLLLYQCFMKYVFSYSRMYKDVRAAVDLCHRDGTLKKMVAKDPKK